MSVRQSSVGVFVLDDHKSIRQSLARLIEYEAGFEVAGQAGTLEETRGFLKRLAAEKGAAPPLLGLLDLNLPDGDGTEVIADFQALNPEFSALVLTASIDDLEHARAIETGASGVLHKASDVDDILDSLRMLANGESLLDQDELVRMVQLAASSRRQQVKTRKNVARLTKREMQVLTALSEGKSNKQIATDLRISLDTERTHMVNILSKLEAHSRLQALVVAVQTGLVEIERLG
ncbi:LuxR C-terminal-related transcriptional regulator [Rubrobacter indicoceani]|uniref:LuxR C-terminal-related transcriptional regulator n=1 Tax=Rubrobacter indicoceani TaxID=2051957 RepID=UPI001F093D74|nr:response regulator transcription factor [Rubrobacter indicoceani]